MSRQLTIRGIPEEVASRLSRLSEEFFVTITRKVPHPLDPAAAESLLRELSTWTVFAPETRDVLAAIALHRKAGIAFWDAMILHGATELGCDVVWSEDLDAGHFYGGVTVRSPFEPAR
jgi:predicted nucleic acid-binding protein